MERSTTTLHKGLELERLYSQEFELCHPSSIQENCTPQQSIYDKTPPVDTIHRWTIKSKSVPLDTLFSLPIFSLETKSLLMQDNSLYSIEGTGQTMKRKKEKMRYRSNVPFSLNVELMKSHTQYT
jgi:hypothetical protein